MPLIPKCSHPAGREGNAPGRIIHTNLVPLHHKQVFGTGFDDQVHLGLNVHWPFRRVYLALPANRKTSHLAAEISVIPN
jgi:hypothetical protein